MKYPQLVSPRAVNAISDWLVSRLEQLGVESPQIYTRLLLSLLQSSVQVNDPIEYSNLEAFFANRKGGGHKRFHLPSDSETLKKLNAVQCLREIVSNEQETATIEQLVDELCEKLKDIEKQTQDFNNEEPFLIGINTNTNSLPQTSNNSQQQQYLQQDLNSSSNNPHHTLRHQPQHQIYNNSQITTNDFRRHVVVPSDCVNDFENDPKKRYFRAFPALSKEMEDSFRIWRRNAKSLTWPVVGRSIAVDNCNNNNNTSSITSSSASSTHSSVSDKIVEKKLKSENNPVDISNSCGDGAIGSSDVQQQQQQQGTVGAAASVKKKSKRRRNQALCKGKTIQNIRKLSVGTFSNSVGGNKYHHYTHHRNSSPAWDTDFKGCWEMGPDLIKEFLSRQKGNTKKHNRINMDNMNHEDHEILNETPLSDTRCLDMSISCDDDEDEDGDNQHYPLTDDGVDYVDEDYDDDNTLTSVSELDADNANPKRLYQREGHLQRSLVYNVLVENVDGGENTLNGNTNSLNQFDFQQFKAKFNSGVEALWKDQQTSLTQVTTVGGGGGAGGGDTLKVNSVGSGGISSAFYATTSLNFLTPFKQDLRNYWSNYNQQNYEQSAKLSSTASTSSMITTRLDDSSASSGAGADNANSSDYFSMPSNLDDFDKSVGGIRRTNEAGVSLGAHTPLINVFLQNSIWSTSGDGADAIGSSTATAAADSDESFLFKVWHSNKKLSQLDVGNNNGEKMPNLVANIVGVNDFYNPKESSVVDNINSGANLQFPPYQNLKWSEGINAGPQYNSLRSNANPPTEMGDTNFVAFNTTANITGATWEAPAYGQNTQPDLKSWCASNPISLTEMYGNDVCDSIVNQPTLGEQGQNSADMATEPVITLSNHCAKTSGFVSYARIKQCGLIQPQTKPLQSTANASRLPKDIFKASEEENLLTSERTHFHPIDNYVDGHTFDISSDLDSVDFERSESGLMRYDSEEFLEYTRSDIYMADEEVASSTNLFKFGKPCKDDPFVIKFRVKRSGEVACQTEEQDFQLAAAKMTVFPTTTIRSRVASTKLTRREIPNIFSDTYPMVPEANSEAFIAAVSKAVAAAAEAAATWPSSSSNTTNLNGNDVWIQDISIGDEVDFCRNDPLWSTPATTITCTAAGEGDDHQLIENWSMQEVEKQCHQRPPPQQQQQDIKKKFPCSVNVETNDINSADYSLHTLWGMCAICNSCEYGKSMPPNRLLRDELELEADEIMNDLKHMQDLYISETNISTDAHDNNENEIKERCENFIKYPLGEVMVNMEEQQKHPQPEPTMQVTMLKKFNQLIENLLKPENSVKWSEEGKGQEKAEGKQEEYVTTGGSKQQNVWNTVGKAKNVWQCQEDDKQDNFNRWRHTSVKDAFVKPHEEKPRKQVDSSFQGDDSQYVGNFNWQQENLAKIWAQQLNITPQEECLVDATKQNESTMFNLRKVQCTKEVEGEKLVLEKNLKNVQSSNSSTPITPSSSTTAAATFKRVQQLLNISAGKMKAANRKRRHSASQNFYQNQQSLRNNYNNNNNHDYINDLNAYKQNFQNTIKASKKQTAAANTASNSLNLEEQPTKQTIITCKYWTTPTNGTQTSLDSAAMMLLAAATNDNDDTAEQHHHHHHPSYDAVEEDATLDENTFGNTFSCLIDKNASILKHVTMMARPLTR